MSLVRFNHLMGAIRGGSVLMLVIAAAMVAFHAPVDPNMGLVQKLIYLHLPAAIASFCTAFVVFVASLGFLWTRNSVWNEIARAAAVATVACSVVVLGTGMVWAHFFWGSWWLWSPRLTFTLVMCVLYTGYLAMQYLPKPSSRWEMRCAVYGCVAFLDVPLVYLSIRLMPDVHPTSLPLTSEMRETLVPCFVLAALVCTDVILAPVRRAQRAKAALATSASQVPAGEAELHPKTGPGTFRPQT